MRISGPLFPKLVVLKGSRTENSMPDIFRVVCGHGLATKSNKPIGSTFKSINIEKKCDIIAFKRTDSDRELKYEKNYLTAVCIFNFSTFPFVNILWFYSKTHLFLWIQAVIFFLKV